jgi:hypothetical protein
MSKESISAISCDHEKNGQECENRALITANTKEGAPKYTWFSRGWVEVIHRIPDDHIGITSSHFCPEHADIYVDGGLYNE